MLRERSGGPRKGAFATEDAVSAGRKGESGNLQDVFLNHVRRTRVPVTVFLVNGVRLQGVITSFDRFCILLQRDAQLQLVFKHVVSTVMPGVPLSLDEIEGAGAPEEESESPKPVR